MSYTDDAQTPEETSRQRQTIIIIAAIAALVLIAGCVGLYFFVGNNPAVTQGTSVVQIPTSLPSPTSSLTPIPSATLEDGTGGGGEGETETPTATNTDVPAVRTATLSEIRGTVQIKTAASSDWVTVLSEQAIVEGTSILVNEASSVKLTMTEGTIVRVSPQTQITLTEMHGTTLDPITKINIAFGKVWTIADGGALGFGKFEVETPLGVASVVGTFMGVEHNTGQQPLDIITCLEGLCRYSNTFGVLSMGTLQQLFTDGSAVPGPADPMDPDQIDSWSPTRVPEVITLTPTITPTFTPSSTRTPTLTRTPVNTPNLTSTSGAASTSSAQTSTAAAGNLTSTVFFINATATAGAGSTSSARTATAAIATANQNATNISGTANANATNGVYTATSAAFTATSVQLTVRAITTNTAAALTSTAFASANPSSTFTPTFTNTSTPTATATALPLFSFSASTYSASESAGKVRVVVNLNAVLAAPVSVQLDTVITGGSSSDATSGADFTPKVAEVVNFSAGQVTQNIDITLIDDGLAESNETFQVILSNPSAQTAIGTPFSAIVTINESAQPSVGFSTSAYTVTEGNAGTTNAAITVNLSRAYANSTTVTVDYALSAPGLNPATGDPNCATAGADYDSDTVTGTLTFVPTDTSETFNVVICGETLDELDETINLTLSNPSNASLGIGTAQLTITDDDAPPVISITPGTPAIAEPGGLGGTVVLTFDVNLSTASGQVVTVNYATSAVTAAEGPDYTGKSGTLTFPVTTTGPQQITITVKGDFLDETDETFDVVLSSPTNATLQALPNDRATVTITDDGDAPPTASFSASPYTVTEGNSGQTAKVITVNLDRQSGQTIVLGFSTTNGGTCGANAASAGSDYVSASGSLTFAPEDISEDFTILINGDVAVEPAECLTMTLSIIGGAVNVPTPTSELWINNDDN
jgi:hypothetical protein